MNEDYYNYIGRFPEDNWVQISNRLYDFSDVKGIQFLHPWNLQVSEIANHNNVCVQLLVEDDEMLIDLPPFVKESTNIVYLSLPISFGKHLSSNNIPPSVKTLLLTGNKRFEVPGNTCLPQVERLMVGYGELLFTENNFPNLRYLEFKLDRKSVMLNRLRHFKKLVMLTVGPCPNDVFSAIDTLQLGYLRLNNSKSGTLEGIERIETLTDVWIDGWSKLTSLNFLQKLPVLEDLTLAYCKRLEGIEPLLEIKRLKRLFVWQCKSKAIKQLEPILDMKLHELSIS